MNLKFDLKSILILILFVATAIFFGLWYFQGDDEAKTKIDNLIEKNEILQSERDEIRDQIGTLREKVKEKEGIIAEKNKIIKELERKEDILNSELDRLRGEITKQREEVERQRKIVEDLKNNPPNREGEDLLNSLKNKYDK